MELDICCNNHPDKNATRLCDDCSMPFCAECLRKNLLGFYYCQRCYPRLFENTSAPDYEIPVDEKGLRRIRKQMGLKIKEESTDESSFTGINMIYLRGIKSGAIAGFVSTFINQNILYSLTTYLTDGSIEPKQTLLIKLAISSISISTMIVFGVVYGAILGVIYAVLYSKLPGKNSLKKAVLFSILVFILSTLTLLLAIVSYLYSAASKEIPINLLVSEPAMNSSLFLNLIGTLVFGFLLGKLWDNFGANEIVTDYSERMNPKGIKSWQIAAATVVPTFILALFLILIDLGGLIFGRHGDMEGLGLALGSTFLVISGILAIPAILLKTDNRKKIGAISGIILGALILLTSRWLTTEMGADIAIINTTYVLIPGSIVGVLLILSGIYYFWKKQ